MLVCEVCERRLRAFYWRDARVPFVAVSEGDRDPPPAAPGRHRAHLSRLFLPTVAHARRGRDLGGHLPGELGGVGGRGGWSVGRHWKVGDSQPFSFLLWLKHDGVKIWAKKVGWGVWGVGVFVRLSDFCQSFCKIGGFFWSQGCKTVAAKWQSFERKVQCLMQMASFARLKNSSSMADAVSLVRPGATGCVMRCVPRVRHGGERRGLQRMTHVL